MASEQRRDNDERFRRSTETHHYAATIFGKSWVLVCQVILRLKLLAVIAMSCFASSLHASPKRPYIHEMFGNDLKLSWAEGQRLHEEAMDLYYGGRYVQAFETLERAITEAAQSSTARPLDTATLLTTKAQGVLLLGNPAAAEALLDDASKLTNEVLESRHPAVGRIEFVRSALLFVRGDRDRAKVAADNTMKVFDANDGGIPHALALRTRAVPLLASGDISQASLDLIRSGELIIEFAGKDSLLYGENQLLQSMVATAKGSFNEALRLCRKSLEILQDCLGSDHLILVAARNTLAENYQYLGRFAQAVPVLEANLRTLEITVPDDSILLGTVLNSLGLIHYRLGNFATSEGQLRRCLSIRSAHLSTASPAYAATANNLALVLDARDQTREVSQLYSHAVQVLDRSVGKGSPALATVLLNWGIYSQKLGDRKIAEELISEAIAINHNAFGKDHPATADALEAFARLQCDLQDFDYAKRLAGLALSIKSTFYGTDHPAMAATLSTYAKILSAEGDVYEAANLYAKSANIRANAFGIEHPHVGDELEASALTLSQAGEFLVALEPMALALRSQKQDLLTRAVQLQPEAQLSLAKKVHGRAGLLHALCFAASGTESAFAGAEQSSALKALLEEMQTVQATLELDPRTTTLELIQNHQGIRFQLAGLVELNLPGVERESRRQRLQTELAEIESALANRFALVATMAQEQDQRLEDIAANLPVGSALIDFVGYQRYDFTSNTDRWKENRYTVYLTFPLAEGSTNILVERVDLGEAAPIDEAMAVVSRRMSAGQYRARDLTAAMEELSRLVYAPLARHLTNVAHLIVCPDGQLNRLPFEMLRHNARYLVEDKTISYVTSGREIARLAQPRDPRQSSAPLVMGNPDFDFDLGGKRREEVQPSNAERGIQIVELSQSLLTSGPTRFSSRDFRGGVRFTPLPGSEIEATNVARFLGGEAILRIGPEAREADLKRVVSPRVLHLATHGFFLPDQEREHSDRMDVPPVLAADRPWKASGGDWENPMVRCGLALAGANQAGTITNAIEEDGILTGLEAALLNLQGTELVILSACDSGTGEVKIGEGVMSLRRAFRIAGAETVLASHWPVSDQATSRLMTEFMRRWQAGESRSAAWQQAQLALLQSKDAKDDFSDPYFWAAFTLTGQWRR